MTSISLPASHYIGERGEAYFRHQNSGGSRRGRINARKFSRHVSPNDTVLDFGCANGSLLLNLDCKERIGVEANPAARRVAVEAGLKVVPSTDALPPRCADVVISNHVLEHVLSPHETLCGLRRVLRPRGRLVLYLPMDDWRMQKRPDPEDINHHLYAWTPLLLGNLLSEAGFDIQKICVYTHAWPPSSWQTLDARLPTWLFDLICRVTAWRYKRRQIMAVAVAP